MSLIHLFTAIPRTPLRFPAKINWDMGEISGDYEARKAPQDVDNDGVNMLIDDASYLLDDVSMPSDLYSDFSY